MGLRVRPGRNGVWQISGTVAGRRVRRSARTRDRAVAEQLAAAWEARLWADHIHGPRATRTFAEAALGYMKDGGERRFMPPLIRALGKRRLVDIRPAEIRELARVLHPKGAASTRNRQVIAPARAVINWAAEQGWCAPIRVRQFPAEQPARRAVDADWIAAFRAEARRRRLPYLAALARAMFETGTRIGELVALRPADVDLGARYLRLADTKNGESYEVPISEGLAAELARLTPRRGRVFGYANRWGVYRAWRETCRRAGLDHVPPHQAGRHSFATALAAEGWGPAEIAAAGRWKSVRLVLETYVHPADSGARAADAIGRKLAKAESPKPVSRGRETRNR